MDNLDWAILRRLKDDCRISYSALGRDLNVTTQTIKNRVSNLVRDGILIDFCIKPTKPISGLSQFIFAVSVHSQHISHYVLDEIGSLSTVESISWNGNSDILIWGHYGIVDEVHALIERCKRLAGYKKSALYIVHQKYSSSHSGDYSVRLNDRTKTILRVLHKTPLCSIRKLSESTGLAEKTIRRHISLFKEKDLFQFTINFNPSAGGNAGFIGQIRLDDREVSLFSLEKRIEKHYIEHLWEQSFTLNKSTLFIVLSLPSVEMISDIREKLASENHVKACHFHLCSRFKIYPGKNEEIMQQFLS